MVKNGNEVFKLNILVNIFFVSFIINLFIVFYSLYLFFDMKVLYNSQGSKLKLKTKLK